MPYDKNKARKLLKALGMSKDEEVSLTLSDVTKQLEAFNKVINIQPLIKAVNDIAREFTAKTNELQSLIQKKVNEVKLSIPQDQTDNLLSEIDGVSKQSSQADINLANEIKSLQDNLSKSLEAKVTEVSQTFSKQISDLQGKKGFEEKVKSIQDSLEKLKTETTNRINNIGGGAPNQRIQVNGTTMSSRYADINLKGTGITVANNNTTKQVDIDFSGLTGGATLASVSSDSTDATKSLYTMGSTIPVEFKSSDGNTVLKLDETNEQVLIGDGTTTLPGFAYAGATGTGFYRATTSMGLSITGTVALVFTRVGTNGSISGASGNTVVLNSAANGGHIILTPNGTGAVTIASGATATSLNITRSTASYIAGYNSGLNFVDDVGAATSHIFNHNGNTSLILTSSQKLLVGGLSTEGTGVIQFPAATTSAGGITFGTDTNLFRSATNILDLAGTRTLRFSSTANPYIQNVGTGDSITFADANGVTILAAGTGSVVLKSGNATALTLDSSQNATFANKVTSYNGVSTAGWGVPAIYGAGRATGQTVANTSVSTYTVGAADGSFEVSANVLVTTSSAENFTTIVTYTDEGNTARTLTLNFQLLGGVMGSAINFSNGAVPYEGIPVHLRCKASTAITVKTTGTFTGATYNVEGIIRQLA